MTDFHQPLPDVPTELAARADAGQKLGMQSLEFVMGLAAKLNQRLDIEGAARAMETSPVVDQLSGQALEIERRSRAITVEILRRFAQQQ